MLRTHRRTHDTKVKRTFNLSGSTVRRVRELATEHLAISQDALVEMAVNELDQRISDELEAEAWAAAARDPEFQRESTDLEAAYSRAGLETWPA